MEPNAEALSVIRWREPLRYGSSDWSRCWLPVCNPRSAAILSYDGPAKMRRRLDR